MNSRGSARRADIQGLRAVAVILVVAFHAGLPVPGGFIGVDMFFVISGFVIAAMLLRKLGAEATVGFADFYARRTRRLMPALALASVSVAVLSVFLLSPLGPQQSTAHTGTAASLIVANIQLLRLPGTGYFDLSAETNAMLHTWSLSVEEQFYLAFPLALLLVWRLAKRFPLRRSSRRSLAVVIGLATIVSFAFSTLATYHPSERLGTSFAFYSVFTRAWEFGVGALLALVAHRLTRLDQRVAVGSGLVGLALVAFASVWFDGTTQYPGWPALFPVVGTALLLVAGGATTRGVSAVLSTRPAVWVGDVSYGWYLWHWPLIVFTAAMWPGHTELLTSAAAFALLPTVLSYRYVENPIRFNDRLVGRRVLPMVAICVLVPILAFQGLLLVNRAQRSSDVVSTFARNARVHADRERGCDEALALDEREGDQCTWAVDDPKGEIFLVGDSNAGQFTEPIAAAANKAGYDFTVVTTAGCPFADLVRSNRTDRWDDGTKCHQEVLDTTAELVKRKPALVVVASSGTEYVNGKDETLRFRAGGRPLRDPDSKARLWQRGLTSVLTKLGDAGVPTLVVHTIPQHNVDLGNSWSMLTCPMVRIRNGSCGGNRSRAGVEAEQALTRDAETRAVVRSPLSTAIDFIDDVCTDTDCPTRRQGVDLYRDSSHLSIAGAEQLTAKFQQAIEKITAQP